VGQDDSLIRGQLCSGGGRHCHLGTVGRKGSETLSLRDSWVERE
jgi:hypothetical protein